MDHVTGEVGAQKEVNLVKYLAIAVFLKIDKDRLSWTWESSLKRIFFNIKHNFSSLSLKAIFPYYRYQFDREKLKDAHEYCQQQATNATRQNIHVIVIDNTNLQHWEMKFYLNLARNHLYLPVVVEPQTTWAMNPSELAVKNVHNISEEVLTYKVRMLNSIKMSANK